ncbi:hypothetical protein ACFWYW_47065 [Nonomuraea sp. NPDC059023]|uniref:hypothetical protein n=1 Tax=unclassified Nonomuraea TaxID=2593643 RepID=UPI003693BF6B
MVDEAKLGRPTKLTLELQEELCAHLRKGNYLNAACALVGIHESTVYRWLERGEAAAVREDEHGDLEPDVLYREFFRAAARAKAEAEAMFVSVIVEDAKGGVTTKEVIRHPDGSTEERTYTPPNSRPALEWLARTQPTRWAPKKALEVSGPGGAPVQLSHQADIVSGLVNRIAAVKAKREQRAGEADA